MSKTNTFENQWLLHVFNNAAVPLVGDASGLQPSAAAGSLYVSLHVGSPGEAGSQTTNETTYAAYARVAVVRTSGGWTVAASNASNAAVVSFPTCTSGGPHAIDFFGVGTAPSGAGSLLYYGALNNALAVSTGITSQFAIGELDVNED